MNIEIIRPNGDLKREVWCFSLQVYFSSDCIYFERFAFQTRENKRHKKWITQLNWERLNSKNSNMDNPPVSTDVEAELRKRCQEYVATLPITK